MRYMTYVSENFFPMFSNAEDILKHICKLLACTVYTSSKLASVRRPKCVQMLLFFRNISLTIFRQKFFVVWERTAMEMMQTYFSCIF